MRRIFYFERFVFTSWLIGDFSYKNQGNYSIFSFELQFHVIPLLASIQEILTFFGSFWMLRMLRSPNNVKQMILNTLISER